MPSEEEPDAGDWLQSRGFTEEHGARSSEFRRPTGWWQLFFLVGVGLAGSAALASDDRLAVPYRLAAATAMVAILARSSYLLVRIVRSRREWWG